MSLKDIKDKTISYFKEYFHRRGILLIIFAVLFLMTTVLKVWSDHIILRLYDQHLAERWADDMRMAQVSLYITEEQMINEERIKKFEYMLKKKLVESGVTGRSQKAEAEKDSEKGIIETIGIDQMNKNSEDLTKLFAVAYSAQGIVDITFENRKVENAAAIGVGGEFFLFHPMTFVSGTWFLSDSLMKDSIVIDENLAWQLFGSIDIIGQCVYIGNVPHYISGVVKRDRGRIQKASELDRSYVYMSYDSLSKYGTILSGRVGNAPQTQDGGTAQSGGINCVEVVCPNPVQGLAAKIANESMGISAESIVVIDNTERFSFKALFDVIRAFGTRSMQSKAIYYPYWENTARGFEDILALMFFFRIIFIIIDIIIFSFLIIDLYNNKKWTVSGIVNYLSDKKYDIEVIYNQKKSNGK